jgi:hypothetical protein
MRRLLKMAALGAIGVGVRKLIRQRRANPAQVDLREPQKTVQNVEREVGEPVRP